MNEEICQINVIHEESVAAARRDMPEGAVLQDLADTFKLLGDPTRLRILHALTTTEMCVCDLATLLDATPSGISHQLRLLRAAGLVKFRKDGKMAFYSLGDEELSPLLANGLRYLQK